MPRKTVGAPRRRGTQGGDGRQGFVPQEHSTLPTDEGAGMLIVALAAAPDPCAAGGWKGVKQTRGRVCGHVTQLLKAVRQPCVLVRNTSGIREVKRTKMHVQHNSIYLHLTRTSMRFLVDPQTFRKCVCGVTLHGRVVERSGSDTCFSFHTMCLYYFYHLQKTQSKPFLKLAWGGAPAWLRRGSVCLRLRL